MIRNLGPSAESFLSSMERIESRLEEAQRQMTSGLRLSRASDAPDEVTTALQTHVQLARNDQIRTNLTRAKAEVQTADEILQQAVKLLDQATSIAAEGASSTADASRRAALAVQAQSLQQQMVALSRSTASGRYLFGGDEDGTPPYQLNLEAENGVEQLQTAGATRSVEHPSGTTFLIGKTAQQLFDAREEDGITSAAGNVFAALNNLRMALENNDQTAVAAAGAAVHSASEHLNTEAAFYGGVENRIEAGIDDAARLDLQLKTALRDVEDADVTAAILEFTQVQFNRNAALTARSQIDERTLFDYLE